MEKEEEKLVVVEGGNGNRKGLAAKRWGGMKWGWEKCDFCIDNKTLKF